MRLVEGDLANIRRPARTSRASACGATTRTGGSRGIRTSHEYVRKGGAAARIMLVQAAANEWKVPASECTAANSVITHKASNRTHDLRQGGGSRRQARSAEGIRR